LRKARFRVGYRGWCLAIGVATASLGHSGGAAHAESGTAAQTEGPRLVLVGDSTVTDRKGWGDWFATCFQSPAEVINLARGGRSSKSYRAEGHWAKALDAEPDYILIQFGHNDQPGKGPKRETRPQQGYRRNLARYVSEARQIGAQPVLLTSLARRRWDEHGRIQSSLAPYASAVRQVAANHHVAMIDLHFRSIEVYQSLARAGCAKYIEPKGSDGDLDHTHLNELGARLFGVMIADELKREIPSLANHYESPEHIDPKPGEASAPAEPQNLASGVAGRKLGADRTITVATDGSGDFRTVQKAIAAVPDNSDRRTTIHIEPGTYYGQIVVPETKHNVTFEGEAAATTILSYALDKHDPIPPGVSRYFEGTGTVVIGDGFRARHITFRNTAGDHGQAMALRVQGDRARFESCRLIGWQDTLLAHSNRQYYKDCYIEGRVDFIYGGATAVFDGCEIRSKNGGYITAASTAEDQPYGFVFMDCRLTSTDGIATYLGRPWRPHAAVTFINCDMASHIRPEGWHNWASPAKEKTARYREYNNTGPGATPAQRVTWADQLSQAEAAKITINKILSGEDNWRPLTP